MDKTWESSWVSLTSLHELSWFGVQQDESLYNLYTQWALRLAPPAVSTNDCRLFKLLLQIPPIPATDELVTEKK